MSNTPDLYSLLNVHALPEHLRSDLHAGMLQQVIQYLLDQKLADARHLCELVLEQQPDEPTALQLMGAIALQEKNYAQAIDYFVKCIKQQPKNVSAYFNLAQSLLLSGQYASAEKAFNYVLQLAPETTLAYLGLAQVQGYTGKFEAAIQNVDIFFKQETEPTQENLAIAWLHKGMAQGALGDNKQAATSFLNALKNNPQLAQAHFGLGNALRMLGQIENAQKNLLQAIALDATHAPAHFILGVTYVDTAKHQAALACFDKAILSSPKLADAYYYRGLVQQTLGAKSKAERDFAEALAINPHHKAARNAIEQLGIKQKEHVQ